MALQQPVSGQRGLRRWRGALAYGLLIIGTMLGVALLLSAWPKLSESLGKALEQSPVQLAATWLLIAAVAGVGLLVFWRLAARVVGISTTGAYGFRTAAVLISIVIAGVAAPSAMRDLLRVGESIGRLAVVSTPILATLPTSQGGASGLMACLRADWPDGRHSNEDLARGQSVSADIDDGSARVASTKRAVSNPACRSEGIHWQAVASDWALFLVALLASLVLARNLYESYQRQYGLAASTPGSTAPIISYRQWLALIVYSALLAPAVYLALGALVLLQTAAPPPPPTFESVLAATEPAQNEPLAAALDLHPDEEVSAVPRAIVAKRAKWVDDVYLVEANRAFAQLSPDTYASRVLLLKHWRTANRNYFAARLNQCYVTLAKAEAPPPNPDSAQLQDAGMSQRSPPLPAGQSGVCKMPAAEPPPAWRPSPGNQSLIDHAYPWLRADRASQPILLIMGLLGFALIGAAIRTMASSEDLIDIGGKGASGLDASQFGGIVVTAFGAALVVFLAAQAGALLFGSASAASSTNAVFLQLLFCFLGAVFAREVWAWGRARLGVYIPSTSMEGRPAAVEALRKTRDKSLADAQAEALQASVRLRAVTDPGQMKALSDPLEKAVAALERVAQSSVADLAATDVAWREASKSSTVDTTDFQIRLTALANRVGSVATSGAFVIQAAKAVP